MNDGAPEAKKTDGRRAGLAILFAKQEQAFRSEISSLKSVTNHSGEKWRLLEVALASLIEKTIPENFETLVDARHDDDEFFWYVAACLASFLWKRACFIARGRYRFFIPQSPLTYFPGQIVSDAILYQNLKMDYSLYPRVPEQ